jgi:transcriptional regulator with XRE-family HTH domain
LESYFNHSYEPFLPSWAVAARHLYPANPAVKMEMNTPNVIKEGRENKGLSKKDLAQALGISEMHVYDLESYAHELENTLNIEQIFKLARLLQIIPEKLFKGLGACNIEAKQAFKEIEHLINDSTEPIETLSEKIGWDIEFCACSVEAIKKQPIMFFKDFALWFKVPLKSILPNLKHT